MKQSSLALLLSLLQLCSLSVTVRSDNRANADFHQLVATPLSKISHAKAQQLLGQKVLDWTVKPVFDELQQQEQQQEQEQEEFSFLSWGRRLDTTPPLNVVGTCQGYNKNPQFDCSCRRSQQLDVFADCLVTEQLCTPDNSTCYVQKFSVILDGRAAYGEDFLPSSRMTTCTKQLDLEADTLQNATDKRHVLQHETCVEVQPRTPGRFNESVLCGASLDGRHCHACSQCPLGTGETKVTIDCCNVKEDAKSTCSPVHGQTGITLPQFDPAGTHKGCDGGAFSLFASQWFIWTTVASLVSLVWLA